MTLLSIKEASKMLRLSVHSLYKMTSGKKISFIKLGNKVLFDEKDLVDYVNSHRVERLDRK